MFGINALSQPELIQNALAPPCLAESHVTVPEQPNQLKALDESLYHSCFIHPLTIITKTLEKLKPKEEVKEKGNESDSLGYNLCFFYSPVFSERSDDCLFEVLSAIHGSSLLSQSAWLSSCCLCVHL